MPIRSAVLSAWFVLLVPLMRVDGQATPLRDVSLRAGQTVRVRLRDGQRFEARLAGVDSSPLALRFARAPQVVPASSIDSLWVRRHGAARGALVGGIVVGGAAFGLGAFVCSALSEGAGCHDWGAVGVFTLAGAGAGGLVGAGVGSLFPRWRRVDPQRVTIALGIGNPGLRTGVRIGF
jgi:hypothetical protein